MAVFKYNMLHHERQYVVIHANNRRAGWAETGGIPVLSSAYLVSYKPIKDLISKEVDSLPREDTRFVL